MCYAAKETKGANVVKWLLEKGADPKIRGLNVYHFDVKGVTDYWKFSAVLETLKETS